MPIDANFNANAIKVLSHLSKLLASVVKYLLQEQLHLGQKQVAAHMPVLSSEIFIQDFYWIVICYPCLCFKVSACINAFRQKQVA